MENNFDINKEEKKFMSATKIGAIFGFVSFLLTFTIIVPILSLLPAMPLELLGEQIFGDAWNLIGLFVSIVLIVIFIGLSFYFYKKLHINYKTDQKEWNDNLIIYFILLSLIIHPLYFYLSFAPTWGGLRDGQVLMQTIYTFPISSLSLIIIGLLIDHKLEHKNNKTSFNKS